MCSTDSAKHIKVTNRDSYLKKKEFAVKATTIRDNKSNNSSASRVDNTL